MTLSPNCESAHYLYGRFLAVTLTWLAHGLAAAGRTAEAEALLTELTAASPGRYVSPYRLALVHTGLGNTDAAFEALEAAHDERAVGLVNLAVEPRFDPLRSDARFARLLGRLGLESAGCGKKPQGSPFGSA